MFKGKIFYTFVEGMNKEKVVWYEDNYNAVLNGTDGHHEHPEVETHFDVVRQAIESPNQVKQSKNGKDGLYYYAWYTGGREYPNSHMKVVLRRSMFGKLKVVTAYFISTFSFNETTIWTRPKNNLK